VELKEATEASAEQIEVIEENAELKEAIEESVEQKEASEANVELTEAIVEQKEVEEEDIVIVRNIRHQDPIAKIEMKKEKSDHHTEPEVPVVVADMKNEEVVVNIASPKNQKNMIAIKTVRVIIVRARVVEQKEVPEAKMFLEVKEVPEAKMFLEVKEEDTETKGKTKDPLVETMEMFINHLKSAKTIITLIVPAEEVTVVPCVEVLQEDTVTMILTKNPRRVTLLLGNYQANMVVVNQHMTNLMNTVSTESIESQESTEAAETASTEVEAEVDMETQIITKVVVTVVAEAMVVNIEAQASTEGADVENTEAVEMANTEAEAVVTNTGNPENTEAAETVNTEAVETVNTEAAETANTEAEVATTMNTAAEENIEVEVVASNSTRVDIKITTISHTNVVEGTETIIIKKTTTLTKPPKMIHLP
jgi:hypothetical protein